MFKQFILYISIISLSTSCSLFGIQNEESPSYKIILKDGPFEIRKYDPYIVAEVKIKGSYKDSSGDAFRILAGYIFGKNKNDKSVSMTSPVMIEQRPVNITMTSPVQMNQIKNNLIMRFSMPSKYNLENLPTPLDKRITLKTVDSKIIAVLRFSWLNSKEKHDTKNNELRKWLKDYIEYIPNSNYSFAGYNPPWTLPFFRRNEVHIELKEK